MKIFLCIALAFIALNSCGINSSVMKSLSEAKDGDDVFIITNAGKKITGEKIKFTYVKNEKQIALDGVSHQGSDIAAYQLKDGYYIRFGKQWLQRLYNGKIQAHILIADKFIDSPEGRTTVTSCYLQKNKGEIKPYTTQNLYDMISDKKSAVSEFNELYKSVNNRTPIDYQYKHLISVLEAYQ